MKLKYLAGFFDGEGCITGSGRDWEVNCTQTEKNGIEPLKAMAVRWGGSLFCATPTRADHSIGWRWKVRGLEAAIALSDMYLYLVIKQDKAAAALASLMAVPRIRRIVERIGEPRP